MSPRCQDSVAQRSSNETGIKENALVVMPKESNSVSSSEEELILRASSATSNIIPVTRLPDQEQSSPIGTAEHDTDALYIGDDPEDSSSSEGPETPITPDQYGEHLQDDVPDHLVSLYRQWRRDVGRANRYTFRLSTARGLEIAHRYVPLLLALGEDGMSSDSSEHDGGRTVYRIHSSRRPRQQRETDILHWLDDVRRHLDNAFSPHSVNRLPRPTRRAYGR
ncbi:hypothetical protein SISSUDRAFT_1065851 [Sistotremastrum suecicum HHB10207 ss-3]|uniref:Uncharacterized protein n=1 Tax=Sistotremastrum suecicum HHB10207 ss-3 TaxID=1314776 RepID=A0A165Z115_9AGAM|nr:hypothetical protein SISSUDRAFT_1065851 [Sistotremastrum suecicum HHB10207 ss-3]